MPLPIRPATASDARAIARVQVAGWHATYPGLVPAPLLEAMTVEAREPIWRRILSEAPSRTLVVAGGGVSGYICFGPQRTDRHRADWPGEIYALYIHPAAQGRGHGTALIRAGARALQAAGHPAATLWVMTGNTRARRFYEGLGGALVDAQTVPVEGGSFDEVAYGWRDLSALGQD